MPRPAGPPKTGGRKKGTPNRVTGKRKAAQEASGLTPVEFMLNMLRDGEASLEDRKWAAQHAAPYGHPRLAAIDQRGGENETHEDWLERVAKKAGL